jgi:protein-tyrosine phosphatase
VQIDPVEHPSVTEAPTEVRHVHRAGDTGTETFPSGGHVATIPSSGRASRKGPCKLPNPMASILVVCTGNVCRSPIAEGSLRASLVGRFGGSAPSISSAGIEGLEGSPPMPEAIEAAAERGIDIASHRARRLSPADVAGADLVLGMSSEHRTASTRLSTDSQVRTFTLKELVRIIEALPPPGSPSEPRQALVSRVAEADRLRRSGFGGNPNDEDVIDPLGLPLDSYRAVAWELEGWCLRLAVGIFGVAPSPAGAFGNG